MLGPSSTSIWKTKVVAVNNRSFPILFIPDITSSFGDNPQNVFYYLPDCLEILGRSTSKPVFSLNVILSQMPEPGNEDILPLIQQSSLAFDLTLRIPPDVIDELSTAQDAKYHPLFVREMVSELSYQSENDVRQIASVRSAGLDSPISFSVMLDRESTIDVISAMKNAESKLKVSTKIRYRAVGINKIIISSNWSRIHDFLKSRFNELQHFSHTDLIQAFGEMLGRIILVEIFDQNGRSIPEPIESLEVFRKVLGMFSVVLIRKTPDLDIYDNNNYYSLRERPHELFMLNYSDSVVSYVEREISILSPFDKMVSDTFMNLDLDKYIHFICLTANGGNNVTRAPRRIFTESDSKKNDQDKKTSLMVRANSIRSVSAASTPNESSLTTVNSILASDQIRLIGGVNNRIKLLTMGNIVVVPFGSPIKPNLPIITNIEELFWPDFTDKRTYWYPPFFTVIEPFPAADPANSPFIFTYERTGVTSSGEVGLKGTVVLTLRMGVSDAVVSGLQALGITSSKPIRIIDMAVSLEIPFIDERDSSLKRHSFASTILRDGDLLKLKVELSNAWVRICYGVLGWRGFQQQEKARLCITYSFEGYFPIPINDVEITAGNKRAFTPLVYSRQESEKLKKTPFFDVASSRYVYPGGEIHFTKEQTAKTVADPAVDRPAVRANFVPLMVRPPITSATVVTAGDIGQKRYGRQKFIHQEFLDVFFDCGRFGSLYRENTGTTSFAIGCTNAMKLGEISYKQYEEIFELNHTMYRVFRSLQQPGRFLILPTIYRITRYDPIEADRAYKQVVSLYSSIHPEEPADNRVIIHATLQPDIPLYVRKNLEINLKNYSGNPVVEYPTEIQSTVNYSWIIDGSLQIQVKAERGPDYFQVYLTTDVTGSALVRSLLENSGIFGSVQFHLPDGTGFSSNLALELRKIVGPWRTGPVEVKKTDQILLTNRINQSMVIRDVAIYRNFVLLERRQVGVTMPAGSSTSIPINLAENDEVYPEYEINDGSQAVLDEIATYVEDISMNFIFLDLINYPNHGLKKLEIHARLKGVERIHEVTMNGDPPTGNLDIIMPLTKYLEDPVLQFKVTKHFQSGNVSTSPWIEWNINSKGVIIQLFWELIQ